MVDIWDEINKKWDWKIHWEKRFQCLEEDDENYFVWIKSERWIEGWVGATSHHDGKREIRHGWESLPFDHSTLGDKALREVSKETIYS